MKFDDAVEAIWRITELRRISGAHVVDHRQLSNDELKAAIIKAKPQYLDIDTVRANLEVVLFKEPRNDFRVLCRLILIDVLLNQYDFELLRRRSGLHYRSQKPYRNHQPEYCCHR